MINIFIRDGFYISSPECFSIQNRWGRQQLTKKLSIDLSLYLLERLHFEGFWRCYLPIIFKLKTDNHRTSWNKIPKIVNLLYYDSMGMLASQRMIENDSDVFFVRNLVNKLILILDKISYFQDFQYDSLLHLSAIFQRLCQLSS